MVAANLNITYGPSQRVHGGHQAPLGPSHQLVAHDREGDVQAAAEEADHHAAEAVEVEAEIINRNSRENSKKIHD